MSFTASDLKEAQKFVDFYVDKMEHHRHLFQYHLAEDVVLDWFGQTVKGEKKVIEFLRDTAVSVAHILGDALPAKKIGFRETHHVKVPRTPKIIPLGLASPPRTFILRTQTKTPKKQPIASTSSAERAAVAATPAPCRLRVPSTPASPAKKMRTAGGRAASCGGAGSDCETVEGEAVEPAQQLRFAVAEGALEFHRPSSKKFQLENKWRRPCKLSVAYTATSSGEYAVYLIIYEGNMRCRRNLMKDFEAGESEN